jgi:hypothetical protein
MTKEPIAEKFVNHIWNNGYFKRDNLRSKDGRKIEILCPGEWNTDSGADFRNASIKIENEIYKGDVEIHVKSSDWRIHHHDRNPKYNSTILHVTLLDGGFSLLAKKQNGEHIPILVLANYLDRSIGNLWKSIENDKDNYPCLDKILDINKDRLSSIVDKMGIERLNIKSGYFKEQFKSKGEDQSIYEGIMDALGYSKNRKQFLELANKVPFNYLSGKKAEYIQAILFGVAGLLPDHDENGYIRDIKGIWRDLESEFKDKAMSAEQWNFFRLRPENFPTKRIAGMSYIISHNQEISLMKGFLSAISDNSFTDKQISQKLRKILMPSVSGYWANHYNFGHETSKQNNYLIGKNRADDIIVNVIFPSIIAYWQKIRNRIVSKKILQLYTSYPPLQDNWIIRFFIGRVFHDQNEYSKMINSALRQQGLIHIYKSSCSAKDCINCPFIR